MKKIKRLFILVSDICGLLRDLGLPGCEFLFAEVCYFECCGFAEHKIRGIIAPSQVWRPSTFTTFCPKSLEGAVFEALLAVGKMAYASIGIGVFYILANVALDCWRIHY